MNGNLRPQCREGTSCVLLLGLFFLGPGIFAQEDDYDFMPPHAWAGRSETGEDDASSMLADGFEGLTADMTKNTMIEPVDGNGGYDNIAPTLSVEEGPGGLEWDPSPTYRTRYKGSTDYPAGSATRLQGNNWFLQIPYVISVSSTEYRVRFSANTFRVYTGSGSVFTGKYGNINSKFVRSGSSGTYLFSLYDTRGKTFTFQQAYPAGMRCTRIEGLGGAQITFDYSLSDRITVLQKPNGNAGSEVRRFTYWSTGSRIDRIDIEDLVGGTTLYRKINFVYFEEVTGAVEGTAGDLIGI
ncbi:MAG TPA: hypothetical protein VF944_05915, partial [Candidatus Bathyarchaeia archaeon]